MPFYKFKRENDIVSYEEMKETLEKVHHPDERYREGIKALLVFLYIFGTRISEALTLKRIDFLIDEDGNLKVVIPLKKKRRKKTFFEESHILEAKNNTPFLDILKAYLAKIENVNDYVFPFSRSFAWKMLKKAKNDISPHVFRHSRLMKLAMLGASESVLMDWAGWADPRPASAYVKRTGRLAAQFSDKIL